MSNTPPSSSTAASAASSTSTSLAIDIVATTTPASMMAPTSPAVSVPAVAAAQGAGRIPVLAAGAVLGVAGHGVGGTNPGAGSGVLGVGVVPGLTGTGVPGVRAWLGAPGVGAWPGAPGAGSWTGVPVASSVGGASAAAAATAGTVLPSVVSSGAYTGGIAGAPGAGGVGYTTSGFNFRGFPPSQGGFSFARAVFGGGTGVPVKMDNVPKMMGSFDLYAVQLHTFLTRMGCWAVVDGFIDWRDPSFAAKDNLAREAILYGVAAQDAEMICQEDTAQAMWARFVDKQTKREYSNYIFARAEFYSHVYSADKSMEQWLREMESMRRQLLHYGKRVTDEDFAETLLGHVARSHRDVVQQFSKHCVVRGDGGADRPVPTATQVMNALRAESALDEQMGTEDVKPAGIAACGKEAKPPKGKKQNSSKGKRKRSGHGKRQKDGKPVGKKSGKQETRTCYHCGEAGHIRPNCPNLDDDSSDDQAAGNQTAISERKRWQKRPGCDGEIKRRKVRAVGCILREALTVGSVSSASEDTVKWALDSASDVHVCKQSELLSELQHDSKHVFQGYDGKVTDNERVGNVHLRVKINKQPHQDVSLQLQNVLLKPSAPDNLLSLDALEKAGWTLKTGKQCSDRIAWITKGRLQLLLVKSGVATA